MKTTKISLVILLLGALVLPACHIWDETDKILCQNERDLNQITCVLDLNERLRTSPEARKEVRLAYIKWLNGRVPTNALLEEFLLEYVSACAKKLPVSKKCQ